MFPPSSGSTIVEPLIFLKTFADICYLLSRGKRQQMKNSDIGREKDETI